MGDYNIVTVVSELNHTQCGAVDCGWHTDRSTSTCPGATINKLPYRRRATPIELPDSAVSPPPNSATAHHADTLDDRDTPASQYEWMNLDWVDPDWSDPSLNTSSKPAGYYPDSSYRAATKNFMTSLRYDRLQPTTDISGVNRLIENLNTDMAAFVHVPGGSCFCLGGIYQAQIMVCDALNVRSPVSFH